MLGPFFLLLVLIAMFFLARFLFRHFLDKTTTTNIKKLIGVLGICFLVFVLLAVIIAIIGVIAQH